ncbi:hypothetical protein GGR51DRAFT_500491 [Nemania sp. FL0031]|nr:hypothetical protein GGR51DRAFT_500491 [Nemania sp. FL0031]
MEKLDQEPLSPTPSTTSTASSTISTTPSTASTISLPYIEENVSIFDPMPHRYMFVPDRNLHTVTACRERTHAIGRPVYIVHGERGEFMGLRVPHYVLEPVLWEQTVKEEEEKERARGGPAPDSGLDLSKSKSVDSKVKAKVKVKPDLDLGLNPELGIFTEEDLELIFEIIGVRPEELPRPGEFDWIVDDEDDSDYDDDDEGYASGGDGGSSSDCSMPSDEDDEHESDEYEDDEMLDLDWTVGKREDEHDLHDTDD